MIGRKNDVIRKFLIIIGSCLLVASFVIFLLWQWNIYAYEQKANECVSVIREIISEPQGAILGERRDNAMATLSINGTDVVGLLELPQHESVLPVCADWGNPSKYPCRFDGSIYDRTMQIGATTQSGQYDYYRNISVGDSVLFTDMEGNRYSYSVSDICYEKNADQSTLKHTDSALTLFIKNIYAFEYIIIYCDVLN